MLRELRQSLISFGAKVQIPVARQWTILWNQFVRDHKCSNGNKKGKLSDPYENDGDPYKAAYDSDYGLQFSIHTVF